MKVKSGLGLILLVINFVVIFGLAWLAFDLGDVVFGPGRAEIAAWLMVGVLTVGLIGVFYPLTRKPKPAPDDAAPVQAYTLSDDGELIPLDDDRERHEHG